MAKEKKVKPTFQSPYKNIAVTSVDSETNAQLQHAVEVVSIDEIESQINIRLPCIMYSKGQYSEKTINSFAKRHEKLFDCQTAEEVIKRVIGDVNASMTAFFKYRTYAKILQEKLSLIENEEQKKAINMAIFSLENHGCIHPQIKDILNLITKD